MVPHWLRYVLPNDRREDFQKLIDAESQYLKGTLREYGDLPMKLFEHESGFKNLRLLRSLQKLSAIINLVTNEMRQGAYDKIVFFAKHAVVMKAAQMAMMNLKPKTLYPGSNPIKAEKDLELFNSGKRKVYISSIVAANKLDFVKFHDVQFVFFLETELDPSLNIRALETVSGDKIYARTFSLFGDTVDSRLEAMNRKAIYRHYHPNEEATDEIQAQH